MVRVFPKSPNQPNEMALTICNSISRERGETGNWKVLQMVRKFHPFRSEREKEEYL